MARRLSSQVSTQTHLVDLHLEPVALGVSKTLVRLSEVVEQVVATPVICLSNYLEHSVVVAEVPGAVSAVHSVVQRVLERLVEGKTLKPVSTLLSSNLALEQRKRSPLLLS